MKHQRCTWDGEAQKWRKPDETTCNEDHCALRGRCANHVKRAAGVHTCGSCIHRTRKHIAAIVSRYALMAYDAQVDGVESEAMNLLGRAAAPEQYAEHRARLAALYERRGWCDWPRSERFAPDDPHHPYAVLGRWRLALEDQGWLGYDDRLVTVIGAANALDGVLDRFAHSEEFEDFAREIAACLAHLESVDHDDRVPEQGRPCPTCAASNDDGKGPRLQKRYAFHPGMEPGKRCKANHCPTCDGRLDAWHCPDDPAHAWTDEDYRNRLDADYIQSADRLTLRDMATRTGIAAGTLRRWASSRKVQEVGEDPVILPPLLTPKGRNANGTRLYRVADVEALDATRRVGA